MKLACIINAWDAVEILPYSLCSVAPGVDLFIIVYQTVSNFGEVYDPFPEILASRERLPEKEFIAHLYNPTVGDGFENEIKKRNVGLDIARANDCTHFLHLDCDEMYENFNQAKQQYIDSGKKGSACKIFTYFKKPTLRYETEDGYYVPFIHELNEDTFAGDKDYPFYVDPTRRINCQDVILLDTYMHHMSWVRWDIERKCRNSSAKANIERGTMLQDYHNPDVGPGFYVRDADKKLIKVPNQFNIIL